MNITIKLKREYLIFILLVLAMTTLVYSERLPRASEDPYDVVFLQWLQREHSENGTHTNLSIQVGGVTFFYANSSGVLIRNITPIPLTVIGSVNITNITFASNCAEGQVIKWSNGYGICGSDATGGGVNPLLINSRFIAPNSSVTSNIHDINASNFYVNGVPVVVGTNTSFVTDNEKNPSNATIEFANIGGYSSAFNFANNLSFNSTLLNRNMNDSIAIWNISGQTSNYFVTLRNTEWLIKIGNVSSMLSLNNDTVSVLGSVSVYGSFNATTINASEILVAGVKVNRSINLAPYNQSVDLTSYNRSISLSTYNQSISLTDYFHRLISNSIDGITYFYKQVFLYGSNISLGQNVTINSSFVPATDGIYSLGNGSLRWNANISDLSVARINGSDVSSFNKSVSLVNYNQSIQLNSGGDTSGTLDSLQISSNVVGTTELDETNINVGVFPNNVKFISNTSNVILNLVNVTSNLTIANGSTIWKTYIDATGALITERI